MNARKLTLATVGTAVALWGGMANAGPIEAVYGLEVSDADALVRAPTMAELNAYLDGLFASDAYRSFSGEVGDIRKTQTVNMYQRVRTWTR